MDRRLRPRFRRVQAVQEAAVHEERTLLVPVVAIHPRDPQRASRDALRYGAREHYRLPGLEFEPPGQRLGHQHVSAPETGDGRVTVAEDGEPVAGVRQGGIHSQHRNRASGEPDPQRAEEVPDPHVGIRGAGRQHLRRQRPALGRDPPRPSRPPGAGNVDVGGQRLSQPGVQRRPEAPDQGAHPHQHGNGHHQRRRRRPRGGRLPKGGHHAAADRRALPAPESSSQPDHGVREKRGPDEKRSRSPETTAPAGRPAPRVEDRPAGHPDQGHPRDRRPKTPEPPPGR